MKNFTFCAVEVAKISALSSGNIDKQEHLTEEQILPSNQRQIIEQAKIAYSLAEKAFETQIKTIEDQGIKQVKALKALKTEEKLESVEGTFPKNMPTNETKNGIYEIKKWKRKLIEKN